MLLLLLQLFLLHQLLVVSLCSLLYNLHGRHVNAIVEVSKKEEMVKLVRQVKRTDLTSLFEATHPLQDVVVVLVAPTERDAVVFLENSTRDGKAKISTIMVGKPSWV